MAKAPKQKETQQEKALADVSMQQWQDYVQRFRPAESAMIDRAKLTPGERASVKGQASGDAASAFKGLTRATVASNAAAGAKVTSGKAKMDLASNADALGKARGLGAAAAEAGAEMDQYGKQLGIAATGRGIAHDVTSDLAQGARRASAQARQAADIKFQESASNLSLAASVAGAATRRWGSDIMDRLRGDLTEIDLDALPKKRIVDDVTAQPDYYDNLYRTDTRGVV